MADELRHIAPMLIHQDELLKPLAHQVVPDHAADPEQKRAMDEYFARDKESVAVANLLGLWTSANLLVDLANEHFDEPADPLESEEEKPAE